jgi:bifunctional non-homologous end joining protein LigD
LPPNLRSVRFVDQLELRSHEAHYIAFDLLWLNGEDLRPLPLVDRKERLAKILPAAPSWVIYLGHVEGRGTELFTEVRKHDLEGIVAKPKNSTYDNRTVWYKVKNNNQQGSGFLSTPGLFQNYRPTSEWVR